MKIIKIIAVVLILVSAGVNAESIVTRPFVSGSVSKILASRPYRPLMLVFWSVECTACLSELAVLADVKQRHGGLNIVLVATDDLSVKTDIESILREKGLEATESWVFADDNTLRLRYEIDQSWYGELPRTYFYDKNHTRFAVSGGLTTQEIENWLSSVLPLSPLTNTAEVELDGSNAL